MSEDARLSPAFRRFLHAFFEPLSYEEWRNGLDVQALWRLSPDERERAEDLLLQALEQGNSDQRIVIGLGELRTRRAVPWLKKRVQAARGERSVIEPALALWQIAQAQEALAALIEALASLPDEFGRMDAAIALGQCRCQQATQALQAALTDEAYLVRYHATNALLIIHGLWSTPTRDHPLAVKMMADDPQQRARTLARVLARIEKRPLPPCQETNEAD